MNLRLAVKRVDGLLLRPGEVFSYWRLIGKPTRNKGYVEGMVLRNGPPDTWQLQLKVGETHLSGCWRVSAPQSFRYQVVERNHEMRGNTGAVTAGITNCTGRSWMRRGGWWWRSWRSKTMRS